MRKAVSIIFVLIICCQFSKEAFFLSWYHLNRASFTEQFCVNIERPELDCHGQCKMESVLETYTASQPDNDQVQAPNSLPNFKLLNNSFIWAGFLLKEAIRSIPNMELDLPCFSFENKVFRPPTPA